MRATAAAVLAIATACKFQPVQGALGGDAPVADAVADVAIDAPTPWGTATPVITAVLDDDPTLTSDLLQMVFNRTNDIYVVTRTAVDQPWSSPVLIAELSTGFVETTPEMTGDGKTIYLSSDRTGTLGMEDIWTASRSSAGGTFGAVTNVTELNTTETEAGSAPTSDGLAIYFNRDGPPDGQMFVATRAVSSGPFGAPVLIAELDTPADELDPFLSADGLTLYYDVNSNGNDDLYVAHRTAVASPFSPGEPITELNTPGIEADPWVSPDQHHIFFTSDRGGVSGIWEATR